MGTAQPAGHGSVPGGADLHRVADVIPHIVWAAAPDGSVDYLNRRALEYTGLDADPDPYATRAWLDLVHPDDVERARRCWQAATGRGTCYEVEFRIRRHDGRHRWHRVRGEPIRDAGGDLVRWVGTCTDIDEQKALEDDLRRSQRETAETLTLLETLQSAAPVGFGFVDREFRYVRVNETLAAMNHAPVSEHLGRTVAEVIPAVWPQVEPAYRRALQTGEAVLRLDTTAVAPDVDGRLRSWLASYYPVRVENEIVGVGFIVVDVTERRRAEEFRSVVVDNMVEGLCTVDDRGVVTSLNPAAGLLLGWDEADLLGRSLHGAVQPRQPDGSLYPEGEWPLPEGADGDPVHVTDQLLTRRDGTTFPTACSVAPLRVGSTVVGAVVVFRDNTELREQRQREVEARHDQKLESLGRLSAGLAHEINTPIQFVGDNTRFLASAYQDMLDLLLVYRGCMGPDSGQLPWEERKRRAEEAELKADIEYLASEVPAAVEQSLQGIERVASLVRAMKSFSYKDTSERGYADLNEAIQTTLTVARNEVKYVADVVLDLGELPEVLCHVGDLNQVFLNLLVNAADAMQDKGERGEIRITTRADGPTVVLTFADNGCGIPDHIQQAVFEPFFTTKEVGKGTGQGLALARAVCDKHGGTIEMHSEVGKGTQFVLRLPVAGKRAGVS